ncbi:MAG: hypothetical protein WC477_01630 [Patescibacteria group bacterium]
MRQAFGITELSKLLNRPFIRHSDDARRIISLHLDNRPLDEGSEVVTSCIVERIDVTGAIEERHYVFFRNNEVDVRTVASPQTRIETFLTWTGGITEMLEELRTLTEHLFTTLHRCLGNADTLIHEYRTDSDDSGLPHAPGW